MTQGCLHNVNNCCKENVLVPSLCSSGKIKGYPLHVGVGGHHFHEHFPYTELVDMYFGGAHVAKALAQNAPIRSCRVLFKLCKKNCEK